VFGGIALVVAWVIWAELRARLQSIAALIAAALMLAALALSPKLIHVHAESGMGQHRVWADNGVDLFELIVPGKLFLMGEAFGEYGDATYRHFTRDVGGYVGLPLLLLAIVFLHARRSEKRMRFLAAMLLIVYVAALGPSLHFRVASKFARCRGSSSANDP
jgi:hypothetical protein